MVEKNWKIEINKFSIMLVQHTHTKGPYNSKLLNYFMDKLWLTGQALGRVYNLRSGCMQTMHLLPGVAIQPNLELKTRPKPVLGSLLLAFTLPDYFFRSVK